MIILKIIIEYTDIEGTILNSEISSTWPRSSIGKASD
jgi:translation initiation factor 2 alpha subunit (eIF-2alpha)